MDSTLSTMMMWMVIMAAALFCRTDADLLFCNSEQMMESERTESILQSDGFQFNNYSPDLDKCMCTVKADGSVYLRSTVKFMTDPDAEVDEESSDTCGPLLMFNNEKFKSYACPSEGESVNETVLTHHLSHDDVLTVEVINSAKTGIQAMVAFKAEIFQGTFSVECETVSASASRGICPCNPAAVMGAGETGWLAASDGSIGTKVAVAVVCVILFLVIFGGLYLLWYYKLRNRDDGDNKDEQDGMPPQQVPVAPEKGQINPQFTDPELNLELQRTPTNSMGSKGLRGSTDSGLYSQGNGQHYANVPGHHGDGLPPDMLYTPGLNLSGHADLNAPGEQSQKRDVNLDDFYAKPAKDGRRPRSRSASRSGSQDQLHMAPQGQMPQQPQGQGYHPQGQGPPQGQGYRPQGQGYPAGPNPYPQRQYPQGPGQYPQGVNESFEPDFSHSSHNVSQASLSHETDV